jgi:putative transposase
MAERFGSTVRVECLDWLLIVNRRPLQRVLRIFVDHDNTHRPHRALKLLPPQRAQPPPTTTVGEIRRHDRLGALIHEYHRDAARGATRLMVPFMGVAGPLDASAVSFGRGEGW